MNKTHFYKKGLLAMMLLASASFSTDWPQWRFGSNRSATTPEQLPDSLHLQWTKEMPVTQAAWDNQKEVDCYGGPGLRIKQYQSFDIAYQPVVYKNYMIFGSPNDNSMNCVDMNTGSYRWKLYAGGPIRFAPIVKNGLSYFASDDGYLYCVDPYGSLKWRFAAGPKSKMVMGNDRLISKWCVRGAPVIPNGTTTFENPAYSAWRQLLNNSINTYTIADANDDLEEKISDGAMDVGSSDLELNSESVNMGNPQIVGLKFSSQFYKLRQGSTVDSAFIQFAVDETKGGTDPCTVSIYAEAADYAGALGTAALSLSSKTKTSASVEWVIPAWTAVGQQGADQRTPDLKNLIQEVVSRPGFDSSSGITILIYSKGGSGVRCADARDESQRTAYLNLYSSGLILDTLTSSPEQVASITNADSNVIYFAAGLYPFEGTFLYAVNSLTGELIWKNDGSHMYYTTQPHGTAEGFSGISPQGYLCTAGDGKLLVPNGRALPALFDRADGRFNHFRLGGTSKGDGGYHVSSAGDLYYCKDFAYNLSNSSRAGTAPEIWDENHVCIKAGTRTYSAGSLFDGEINGATTTTITTDDGSFSATVDGRVAGLVAANGKLLATTTAGKIYCFGAKQVANPPVFTTKYERSSPSAAYMQRAAQYIRNADYVDGSKGIAVVIGISNGKLLEALVAQSDLTVIAFEHNLTKAHKIRTDLAKKGLYGHRINIIEGDFMTAGVPSYIASLVTTEQLDYSFIRSTWNHEEFYREAFRVLRPYGGTAILGKDRNFIRTALNNPSNLGFGAGSYTPFRKVGQLPGTDTWNQMQNDAAQSMFSEDTLVKMPASITWFGGSADNTNDKMNPRHGHGLPPLVAGGRLFMQGRDVLRAVDLYTGRVLWEKEITNIAQYADYTGHEAGHTALGNNLVVFSDIVYVLGAQNTCGFSTSCLALNAATGETIREMNLPDGAAWGMITVYDSLLITTTDLLKFNTTISDCYTRTADAGEYVGPGDIQSRNGAYGKFMVALNRYTGEVIWQKEAANGFYHYAIACGGGKVFAVDKTNRQAIDVMSRLGAQIDSMTTPALYAFDAKTGNEVWKKDSITDSIFGGWLGYSEKHDILVEAYRKASDFYNDEATNKMATYQGSNGSVIWKQLNRSYSGGPVMLDDTLIRTNSYNFNAIYLKTGEIVTIPSPLTGIEAPLDARKHYGCSYGNGAKNVIVVRSGAGGYVDIQNNSGVGNFGGFKTGCTVSLVPAEGVIASPEYTRTCACNYQLQTSCAMVHDPEMEMWTSNERLASQFSSNGGQIIRLGMNFGSSGDRMDDEKTLFLEYPYGETAAGFSAYPIPVDVTVTGTPGYYRHHSLSVSGNHNWVAASGITNAQSISIGMARTVTAVDAQYTVKLYFAETEMNAAGARVFDVSVNGNTVSDIDVFAAVGKNKEYCVTLNNVTIGATLDIQFIAKFGVPMLSGISAVKVGLETASN